MIYPVVELSGLFLACLCLFDFWRGGGGYPARGLAALCLLTLASGLGQMTVTSQIAMSALSKTGQGYLIFSLAAFLLRVSGCPIQTYSCQLCLPQRDG